MTDPTPSPAADRDRIPIASVRRTSAVAGTPRGRYFTWMWLLTLAAICLAVGLVWATSRSRGMAISVRFEDGHGVRPGDRLRYRGIEVGEVTKVGLDDALGGVTVVVDMDRAATGLARAGSQFWIERPVVKLTEVRGLETLISGAYLAVLPGPPDGQRARNFVGLELAPTGELPEGGLEIVMEARQLGGLGRGAPIKYRGLRVGHIVSVGLASDAATVEARGFIEPAFRQLVRVNSQFWNHSGLDVSLGITGLKVDVESMASVAFGGVEFATLAPLGETVKTGHRFTIHDQPDAEWLEAQPRIASGGHLLSEGLNLPQPVRASLHWRQRSFGIKRRRQKRGWVLPLDDGRLLGPSELLSPVKEAIDGETTLEIAGQRMAVVADQLLARGQLAIHAMPAEMKAPDDPWPASRIRSPDAVEDCLVVTTIEEPLILSASRLTPDNNTWRIELDMPIDADRDGASVVAVKDGHLIGVLVFEGGRPQVATMPEKL